MKYFLLQCIFTFNYICLPTEIPAEEEENQGGTPRYFVFEGMRVDTMRLMCGHHHTVAHVPHLNMPMQMYGVN